jgi:tetratricopeptide (TPR) repeat protein
MVLAFAAALVAATPASANIDDRTAILTYANARAAVSFGALDRAAEGYGALLALTPDNTQLAGKALGGAIAAGNRPLAVKAARILEKSGTPGQEARFVLLTEAIRLGDWKEADRYLEAIREQPPLGLLAPIPQAWIAFERSPRSAVAILDRAAAQKAMVSYTSEHRALMLLALGEYQEGAEALRQYSEASGGRALRLRVAGAAQLAAEGKRELALGLLQGDAEPIVAARSLIEQGRPVPGAVDGARAGIAEFLVRIATDLAGQNSPGPALHYARLATFLAPENSETWLVVSDLLNSGKQPSEAVAALDNVAAGDPFAALARDTRLRLLAASGDSKAAIARAEEQARAATAGAAEWARLGDLYNGERRFAEAAEAYGRALALATDETKPPPKWTLHLLRGGALEQAGRWGEARPELEAAYRLAPDQPLVLNYLGYAQLERRENLVEAEKLVREASRRDPDNGGIMDSLGWALFLNGRVREAIELLERAAAAELGDPTIHEHLGDAYYTAGRRVEARFAWQAALVTADESDTVRLRAKIDTGLTPQLASP